jgi:type IV secretory pathway TrbD component
VLLVFVGFFALMLVPVGLLTHNVWWMAFGVAIIGAAMPCLRMLGRYEPELIEVLPRYRTYARHYSAVGSVGSRRPDSRRHQR